jgi:hypothetical protein
MERLDGAEPAVTSTRDWMRYLRHGCIGRGGKRRAAVAQPPARRVSLKLGEF